MYTVLTKNQLEIPSVVSRLSWALVVWCFLFFFKKRWVVCKHSPHKMCSIPLLPVCFWLALNFFTNTPWVVGKCLKTSWHISWNLWLTHKWAKQSQLNFRCSAVHLVPTTDFTKQLAAAFSYHLPAAWGICIFNTSWYIHSALLLSGLLQHIHPITRIHTVHTVLVYQPKNEVQYLC